VPDDAETLHTPWGDLTRAVTVLSDRERLVHDWYEGGEDPAIMVHASDPETVTQLLPRAAAFFTDPSGWHRRATDAVVTAFSEGDPTSEELDDAVDDLVVETIEVHPDGGVRLHLKDSCGDHFMEGYWPAVLFDTADAVTAVTVEA
jgi:hypothetical protein